MKVGIGDFIDTVHGEKALQNLGKKLASRLPMDVLRNANNVIIKTDNNNLYLVKVRLLYSNDAGQVDIEKTYKKEIVDKEFRVVDSNSCKNIDLLKSSIIFNLHVNEFD